MFPPACPWSPPAFPQVLLVGGATRMPAIRRFVRNMTGLDPAEFVVDPDLAVAAGAAVQAGIYDGQVCGGGVGACCPACLVCCCSLPVLGQAALILLWAANRLLWRVLGRGSARLAGV